jgi:hypothetical protein
MGITAAAVSREEGAGFVFVSLFSLIPNKLEKLP